LGSSSIFFSLFFSFTVIKQPYLKKIKQKKQKNNFKMSVYNHRPMGPPTPSRLIELLDAVKGEYDQLAQEVIVCKSQRDEYEHKSKLHHLFLIFRMCR
jgi:hypothetical protein